MKKMAISFHMFKKNLKKDYIKKGRVLDFENHFKKQSPFWDAFVQYKLSEDSEEQKNKGTKRMQENRSTSIILGKEVIRRQFRNGKRTHYTTTKNLIEAGETD